MSRAIVFGGAGFIGTHLVADLVSRGVNVVVADVTPPRATLAGVQYESCDVRSVIELPNVKSADVVYNLAAVHRTPGHPDHEYYDTNIAGAINVTNWATRNDVPAVCFTSSISVYGPADEPRDEGSPLTPNTAYGRSKALAEEIHRTWCRADSQRQLAVVRPAVIFGAGERGNFTRLANALARRRFAYPGRKDIVKACGYVSDLIRALDFTLN